MRKIPGHNRNVRENRTGRVHAPIPITLPRIGHKTKPSVPLSFHEKIVIVGLVGGALVVSFFLR